MVEDEWDRDSEAIELDDLLFVTFDSQRVTVEKMLGVIKEEGFDAEIK